MQVDGGERLVTAVDDEEVMEVEDLLQDENIEMHPLVDTGTGQNDGLASGQFKDPEVDIESSNVPLDAGVHLGKLNAQSEETVSSSAIESNDSRIDQSESESGRECMNPLDGPIKSGSSSSIACTSWTPDFSKLEGEICLDNLSVRELHETFKATFGRETSVKDKQWLKRRIAMGLTNSCDVSTMTFVIKNNEVVKKCKEESLKGVDGALVEDVVVGAANEDWTSFPGGCNSQLENSHHVSSKRLKNPILEDDHSGEDLVATRGTNKRIRKPTRRYIEENSEIESGEYGGKLISSVKNSAHGHSSSQSHVRIIRSGQSDERPVVTRLDSLGGSGVQVPYVCRVRRSRPRENFMALMKLEPSSMGVASKFVQKALGVSYPQPGDEIGNKVLTARPIPGWIQKPLVTESEKEEHLEFKASLLEEDAEMKRMDLPGDNSDDCAVTVPTARGQMRRKHHRPWTLSEVVKLVEGVARYGAGRWSEIKRLAFASHSYRTSVDLKDKWRNLLRASLAHSPTEKGNLRKPASVPIPPSILLRVRELAEMQEQVPPVLGPIRCTASSGRNVLDESRSGYL